MKRFYQRGALLPLIGAMGVALGILVIFISQSIKFNSKQMVYFDYRNQAFTLAESGMGIALGKLSVDPSTGTFPPAALSTGEYQNVVARSNIPVFNSYYIQTTATVTAHGVDYVSRLHTYASVANLGEYFAAMKNTFVLSPNMDAGEGGIYAPNVVFLTSTPASGLVSRAKFVQYVYGAIAKDEFSNDYENPLVWDAEPVGSPATFLRGTTTSSFRVCLGDNQQGTGALECMDATGSNVVRPERRQFPLQFPVLRTGVGGDFDRYLELADDPGSNFDHAFNGFLDLSSWTDIFPPGYDGSTMAGDQYLSGSFGGMSGHNSISGANVQKVYYASDGIKVGNPISGTQVRGQILLVTPGSIYISGNIFSNETAGSWPGDCCASSSTASQLVLIAGQNIVIQTTAAVVALGPGATRTVEAFFFAPNGQLYVDNSDSPVPAGRNFTFKGSWVLGQTALAPNNFPTQFNGNRVSEYMTTLKTKTPPYLPSLSEIHRLIEEILQ